MKEPLVICNKHKNCIFQGCPHKELHNHGKRICEVKCVILNKRITSKCVVPRKYTNDMLKPGMLVQLKSLNTIKRMCHIDHDLPWPYAGENLFDNTTIALNPAMHKICGTIITIGAKNDVCFVNNRWSWPLSCIKHIIKYDTNH